MVDILREIEGFPESYPTAPEGLSEDAQALNAAALWQRLEFWITHRWGERSVTWIVEGPGDWLPRLKPATVDTFEVWKDGAWKTTVVEDGPLCYVLQPETYRITATVGADTDPPAGVLEAFRRLAEYLADDAHIGGVVASSGSVDIGGAMTVSAERSPKWQARALHYSGAADLLRPWRV